MDLKLPAVSESVQVAKSVPCDVVIYSAENVTGHHSILSGEY